MRILVTGSGGLLGSEVVAAARAVGIEVMPLGRPDLDVTDDRDAGDAPDPSVRPSSRRRHLRLVRGDVRPTDRRDLGRRDRGDDADLPPADPLASSLRAPAGTSVPELPVLDPIEQPEPTDEVLASARPIHLRSA